MTVETEVATLTTAVDNLTSAVNVSKATLDAKVVNAQSAETGAIAASGTASGFSTAAAAHKDQAYTYSQSAASAVAYQDLTAIAATKSVTATDVFVYDTSKDSDGGAWRKRTQGTSWYNEALNTATRGSRKEFPAVAVIVAEAAKVTIYDGDDPSMPMWMQMTSDGGTLGWPMGVSSSPNSSVFMLNGILVIGATGGYKGLRIISLLHDEAMWSWNNTGAHSIAAYGWSTINSLATSALWSSAFHWITGGSIVDGNVNDIAMTVLPNAPIDSATGLPIPTILVGTDGGWSQINADGTVYAFVFSTNPLVTNISFKDNNTVVWHGRSSAHTYDRGYFEHPLLTADTVSQTEGSFAGIALARDTSNYPQIPKFSNNSTVSTKDVIGGNLGLVRIEGVTDHRVDGDTSNGAIALITSDYNTGYMVGDIKLAALSDTDDTDVTDAELVTNGTFASNTTGWITNDSTLSVVSGKLLITGVGGGGGYAGAWQILSCVVGQQYSMSWDFVAGTHECHVDISGATGIGVNSLFGGTGSYSIVFTATSATPTLKMYINGTAANNTGTYDNISVRLADTDRSVNANGLAVHGTIGKTPVATGADLVAYSGFSSSNYLEQPYNSDLNFGTGDFSVMGWMKWDSSGSNGAVLHRTSGDNVDDSGTSIALYSGSGGLSVRVKSTTLSAAKPAAMWTHYSLVRSSGVLTLYLDGVQSTTATSTDDISDTAAVTYVGSYYYGGNFTSSGLNLALQRISATAPSAQQIKDIYEAEKPLFQENAQATLYGTSDAVTALAHDSDTNLLHVGTSSGRSVFQGLQRVDNTTTAVVSAISASNNLVVEG